MFAKTTENVMDNARRMSDDAMKAGEVLLEAEPRRAVGVERQQPRVHPRLQVDPDRSHVAGELLRRFLEHHVQTTFAATASRLGEMCRDARLARTRRARHEHRAAAEEPLASQHVVEERQA